MTQPVDAATLALVSDAVSRAIELLRTAYKALPPDQVSGADARLREDLHDIAEGILPAASLALRGWLEALTGPPSTRPPAAPD
jgi:hypothetical protein